MEKIEDSEILEDLAKKSKIRAVRTRAGGSSPRATIQMAMAWSASIFFADFIKLFTGLVLAFCTVAPSLPTFFGGTFHEQ